MAGTNSFTYQNILKDSPKIKKTILQAFCYSEKCNRAPRANCGMKKQVIAKDDWCTRCGHAVVYERKEVK